MPFAILPPRKFSQPTSLYENASFTALLVSSVFTCSSDRKTHRLFTWHIFDYFTEGIDFFHVS